MKEANVSGNGLKTGGNNPFQDFGDGLEENNDAKRGRRVIGGLAVAVVKDYPICHFH